MYIFGVFDYLTYELRILSRKMRDLLRPETETVVCLSRTQLDNFTWST